MRRPRSALPLQRPTSVPKASDLARIEVIVTVEGVDPYWEWEIDGIKMDKQFFADADWPHPAVDTSYSSLTGPLRFAFDARRMAPRDASDIVQ